MTAWRPRQRLSGLQLWEAQTRNSISVIARRVGLVSALVVAAACSWHEPARAQVSNDHLIVPWERIGPVALGMTAAELIHILGHPTNEGLGPLDLAVDVYNWKDNFSVTVKKGGSYATQICVLNPAYSTVQGVHPGSTDVSVLALLGEPQNSKVSTAWWKLSYTNLYWPGLMVSIHLKGFDTNHQVWEICVNHFA
jgi:hypothetical protein